MKIKRNVQVPTGNILVAESSIGDIEFLSLGDYGKEKNVKADFLGLSKPLSKVTHSKLLPLEDKWVITVSTQAFCSMNCGFCDVPRVKPKDKNNINLSLEDLVGQVFAAMNLHPEVKSCNHLNVHFARMGEPTWNANVLDAATWLRANLYDYNVHPVVSTMMPKNNTFLSRFIREWMNIKNLIFEGNAGLQLSINSTNDKERSEMFCGNALGLNGIANIMSGLPVSGRKITLNFAVAGYEINPDILLRYFSPEKYIIKLTPMHKTKRALANNIKTTGDYTEYYPYEKHEEELRKAGYDVLVFIASEEEDLGKITCGNAILATGKPEIGVDLI